MGRCLLLVGQVDDIPTQAMKLNEQGLFDMVTFIEFDLVCGVAVHDTPFLSADGEDICRGDRPVARNCVARFVRWANGLSVRATGRSPLRLFAQKDRFS